MKTKNYTKHKKNDKKPDLAEGQWKPGEYKDETQLDRIERKLDELLKRQPIVLSPQPVQWIVPHRPPEEPRYPTDHRGQPVPYAVSMGGTR